MSNAVAIITARGGSKRIPRKNIKDFLGSPIIRYSIDAAIASGCFDEVMVSTDDLEIARIAKELGAKVPFYRSAKASDDFATSAEVLDEVLGEYRKIGMTFDYFCCIYPTAPFVTPEILRQGLMRLQEANADTLLPVVRFSYPIQRALMIESGLLRMIWPENMKARSQDLQPVYHDAGQFYWCTTDRFLRHKRLFSDNTVPIVVPESRVQDIDTDEDWKIAELKYSIMRSEAG